MWYLDGACGWTANGDGCWSGNGCWPAKIEEYGSGTTRYQLECDKKSDPWRWKSDLFKLLGMPQA